MFSQLAYQYIPMSETHHWYRTKPISAVVIHHTACIVQDARNVVMAWEQSNPYTSSTYIIDVKGRITAVIPEENRPYTTSSWGLGERDIDNRAITIECSNNDTTDWSLSEETMDALIKLLADIGKRYAITWRYTGDENGNVHAHRWYAATGCPGDWLYSLLSAVARCANNAIDNDNDDNDDGNDDNDGDNGDSDMTQEQFNEMFAVAMKEYRASLRDNDSSAYSAEAREWAIENGIILGMGKDSDGKDNYAWEDFVTREQMVTFLNRFYNTFIYEFNAFNNLTETETK